MLADGRPVALGGNKQRALLALLVVHANRTLSSERLIDELWGERPPASAAKTLQAHVSRLRRALAAGGDGVVVTRAHGYELTVDPESVDALTFERLFREARGELAAGRVGRVCSLLEEALSLWRGPPLAEFVYERFAELEIARLEELRIGAVEELIEAKLALGRHAEVAGELESLIAQHPYRERLRAQLMLALYRCDRQGDALQAYQDARRTLVEELGIEPGERLRELERAILAQDRTLGITVDAQTVAEPVLVPSRTAFVGRESGLLEVPTAQTGDASIAVSPPPPPSPKPWRARRRSVLMLAGGLLVAAGVAVAAVQLGGGRNANAASLRTIASARCSALHYEGAGSPQFLIAADLPLQPGALETTTPMVDAMTLALERRNYMAGPYRVGLQVCDDATAGSVPLFDPGACTANAHKYASNPTVIGVVGPLASACAMLEVPILNRARGGSVAIVSPSATYVGLTRRVGSAESNLPGVLYPTGRRNYVHVLPDDDVQAAADAILAQRLGLKRVYALDDGEPIGRLFVDDFVRAARRLGVAVAGRRSWDARQRSYASLAGAIAQTHADGVFLGVPARPESIRLLRDLRARLGGAVQFVAPEVFDPTAAALAGAAAEGMTISQPGPPNDQLTGEGKQFAASFSNKFGAEPSRYAAAAAQAIDVLLDAIAHSDSSRSSVTSNLFTTTVSNGILGSFSITPTGDPTLNTVAINRIIGGKVTTFTTVVVPDALVEPN